MKYTHAFIFLFHISLDIYLFYYVFKVNLCSNSNHCFVYVLHLISVGILLQITSVNRFNRMSHIYSFSSGIQHRHKYGLVAHQFHNNSQNMTLASPCTLIEMMIAKSYVSISVQNLPA